MRTKVAFLIIVSMVFCGSCEKKITPEQMKDYGNSLSSVTDQIKIYQQLISSYTALLQETGALDANDVVAVNNLITQADKVTPELQKIANALKEGNYTDTQGAVTLLEGLRAANQATSGFNKYWPAIDAILIIAIAILSWLAKTKSAELAISTTTLGAVTKAISASSETVQAEVKPKVASNLSAANISAQGKALITQTKAV